jgi:hypothetical protein
MNVLICKSLVEAESQRNSQMLKNKNALSLTAQGEQIVRGTT